MKLTWILVFLLSGFILSAYFAFFHNRPRKVKIQLLEAPQQDLALELNSFIASRPDDERLAVMVDNLNWIIRNDYQRDLRVKRVIHQDLKSLVEMSRLYDRLERPDPVTREAYEDALTTITERTTNLRHNKDQAIRDEILLLGEMIEGNDR